MAETLEEIVTSFSAVCPLWDEDVWDALQSQKFDDVELYLQDIFSTMTPENWSGVYWAGIIEGIPSFGGDIDWESGIRKRYPQ